MASIKIFDFFDDRMAGGHPVADIGHHLLPRLTGRMFGYSIAPAYLKDIGTPQAYQEALAQWPPS
jgi:hypothetical protein